MHKLTTLDVNISETIGNGYFISTLQSFLFQIFATNTAISEMVIFGLFYKFHVFSIVKGLMERRCSTKYLETINILSFQKYFKLRIKLLF